MNADEVASLMSLAGGTLIDGWNPTVRPIHCAMWRAGEPIVDWPHTKGWPEFFKDVQIRTPTPELLAEAALLVNHKFVTLNLI